MIRAQLCTDADGKTIVTEASINTTVAKLVAQRLRHAERDGDHFGRIRQTA